jgi:hypothetical protein
MAVSVSVAILLPQQRPRHAAPPQFGTDTVPVRQRLRGCGLSSAGANNLLSKAVSSSSAGFGQVMPITAARRCTRQSPCDRCPAIARTLAHLPRTGTSDAELLVSSESTIPRRHWLLPLARIAKGGPYPLRLRQCSPPHPINRVAVFPRNR